MIFYADILVVDDCSDHIALVSSILQKEGFHVCAATSGRATKAFFEKKLPDLVLLDIQMGDTSGLDVCRELKENERTKDIPIIFMTSEKASDMIAKCFSLGAADYIQKPFSKEEFLARVHTQLKASIQRKEFKAAYEELSQFTSYVSHDLKAPLNIIASLTDELNISLRKTCGEELPEDIKEISDIITSKSSQARLLIDRLLDFPECAMSDQVPNELKQEKSPKKFMRTLCFCNTKVEMLILNVRGFPRLLQTKSCFVWLSKICL